MRRGQGGDQGEPDPDAPLIRIGGGALSLNHLYEGNLVVARTGGGKSSGPLKLLARAVCGAPVLGGALCLCAKPGDRDDYLRMFAELGRLDDVLVFDASGGHRLNFLDYELKRPHGGESINAVELLTQMARLASRHLGDTRASDGFWVGKASEAQAVTLELLAAAGGQWSIPDIARVLREAPHISRAQEDLANNIVTKALVIAERQPKRPMTAHDKAQIRAYFRDDLYKLDERTRSGILAQAMLPLSPFLRGKPYELFSTYTTIVPELTFTARAIIIIDLPVKTHGAWGAVGSGIWKYLFMKAVEARNVRDHPAPVLLLNDEMQLTMLGAGLEEDFQSTARSSRVVTVAATQSINAVIANIGGSQPEKAAQSYLDNLVNKWVGSTTAETADWAARLIGKDVVRRRNVSQGQSGGTSRSHAKSRGWNWSNSQGNASYGGNNGVSETSGANSGWSRNEGWSEALEDLFTPGKFGRFFRTGGKANGYKVDGLLYRPSHIFPSSGSNFTLWTIDQRRV